MNKTLLRYTLALFLCGITTAAMADNDDILISEDFSEFSIPQGWTDNKSKLVNEWAIFFCDTKVSSTGIERQAIIFQKGTKQAYAITPSINYSEDVILSFDYGKTSTDNTSLLLSIENGGTLIGDNPLTVTNKFTDGYATAIYRITNTTIDSKVKFTLNNTDAQGIIDNVLIVKDVFSENNDNSSYISVHKGNETTVKTSRTLKAGIWNTLCLPFDVTKATMEAALGSDKDIQMRTYSSYDATNKIMSFDAVAEDATITAGTPFLIKLNSDVANPTFSGVTISDTPAKAIGEDGSVKFVGTYSPVDLNTDGTHLFITTTGTVAMPTDNTKNHMKGLRAYIYAPDGTIPARLAIDGEMTDIQQIAVSERQPTTLFNLNGQRLQSHKKGLIIKDGKLTFTK